MEMYDDSSTARLMPFVYLLFFLVAFGLSYFTQLDLAGEDVAGITALESKILLGIGVWALIGSWFSLRTVVRRRRDGELAIEVQDPLLYPGTSTSFRLSTTRQTGVSSPKVVLCCVHSMLAAERTFTELFARTLYAPGRLESAETHNQWTGTITIPSEAEQLRPTERELKAEGWDPPLQCLGPTYVVGSGDERQQQARVWELRVYAQTQAGGESCETFPLHVFYPGDKVIELQGRKGRNTSTP